MQVGFHGPVENRHTTQLELLADLGRQLGDRLLDGLVADAGTLERVDVGGLSCCRRRDHLVGQRLELRVLGNKVSLAVELDQRAVLGRHQALGRSPLGTLADILSALDPQRLDGLVEVPVGFGQRVLTGEHAGAGQLPQPLDVSGSEVRHISLS